MGVYDLLGWKMPNTDLKINCLIKKPMLYGNFVAHTSFFGNSMGGGNFYPSHHSYNPANYQVESANQAGILATQNFHFISKQNDIILPICQNFNNGKDCLSSCQYKHLCRHCAGFYPAKDCLSNTTALGSNSVPFRYW